LRERNFGSFKRRCTVSETVDTDKIKASFKSGVLTLILPKNPEAQKPAKKSRLKLPSGVISGYAILASEIQSPGIS
jgi:HSP20 family protein